MINKKFAALIGTALLSIGVVGCSPLKSSSADTSTNNGGEKQLVIVNWKGYGSDDPELIKSFENQNHVKIVQQYMASEQELLTKLRTGAAGNIDVVLPNASILPVAEKEGLLQPIDTSKLTNYNDIDTKFKSLPENSYNANVYAVPWVWGSTAISYNTNLIKDKIDSIQVLWDPKYKGKIAFHDDFTDAIMTAAIALGQNPNHPTDLAAIKKKLIEQKALDRTYWQTGDEFSKLFTGNQISLGLMWSGQTASMKKNGQPIEYVIPKEGAIGWVDNWAIVKGTKNSDLAMKFIDFMISKNFQEAWAKKGGPNPTNNTALQDVNPTSIDSINKLFFISYLSDAEQKNWDELWQEVKAN